MIDWFSIPYYRTENKTALPAYRIFSQNTIYILTPGPVWCSPAKQKHLEISKLMAGLSCLMFSSEAKIFGKGPIEFENAIIMSAERFACDGAAGRYNKKRNHHVIESSFLHANPWRTRRFWTVKYKSVKWVLVFNGQQIFVRSLSPLACHWRLGIGFLLARGHSRA